MINALETLEAAQLLLSAARHQSDLRRSVSTAYYALFHALGQECARLVFGATAGSLRRRQMLVRVLGHEEMRKACRSFASGKLPVVLEAARPDSTPMDPDVVRIAKAFVELYQARINADYTHNVRIARADAANWLRMAREAIDLLPSLRRAPDFQLFLTALMHQRSLSGREQ